MNDFPFYSLVPKDPIRNSRYRRGVLELAMNCRQTQEELWIRCRRDELYFINTMVFTLDPREECTSIPFITYEFQDETIQRLKKYWNKADVLIEKSRDMGASWICLVFIFHRWLFYDMQSALCGSRKEEYVDKRGDKKSLFGKFDFMLDHLPPWLKPSHVRNKLHLRNEANGSTCDGESTNNDFGRGDRRGVVFCDEFAAVENGLEVEMATRDVTNCRIYNSTPQGVGNAFFLKREKLRQFSPDQLITLHWSRHPNKAKGLYTSEEIDKDLFKVEIIDKEYEFPQGYHFIADGKVRSPWYDLQCERASSSQEIAQELDIDYAKSGWQFFDSVEAIIQRDASRPVVEGELIFDPTDIRKKPTFMVQAGGRLRLWINLDINNEFERSEEFAIGCDVATGTGGSHSSNSAGSIIGRVSCQKVAEFTSNEMSPEEWADYAVALCHWFHAKDPKIPALLIWEANGPGGQFSKRVKHHNYRRVFYRQNEQSDTSKATDIPGWWSTKETKRVLLGDYGTALKRGIFKNPSQPAIEELREYIHQPSGNIVHSRSEALKSVDPTSSGENHGDLVIADALAWKGRAEILFTMPKSLEREPPPGSMAYRRNRSKRREQQKNSEWKD